MIAPLTFPPGRLRRVSIVPALTCGLLLAGCGSLPAPGAASAAGGAKSTAQAGTQLLGSRHIAPRSQVPWSKVGPGWELIQYSQGGAIPPVTRGPVTLDLVDSQGGLYQLYRWPAKIVPPILLAWSGDKTRALLGIGSNKIEQITLATGKTSMFTLPRNASVLGYTMPDGTSVLAGRTFGSDGSYGTVSRYTLRGKLELRLAAGIVVGGAAVESGGAIESADGTELVIATGSGLELVSNSGQLIRSLPVRGSSGCNPSRFWTATTVLARCETKQAYHQLWLVPLSGAAPTALTPVRTHGPDLGDIGGWRLDGGLYLQALGACGDQFIARQRANGSASVVQVPGAPANDNDIISASGNRLLVLALTGCLSSNSLLWFNPATGAEQWLVKTPHQFGGVIGVVPYASTENQNGYY